MKRLLLTLFFLGFLLGAFALGTYSPNFVSADIYDDCPSCGDIFCSAPCNEFSTTCGCEQILCDFYWCCATCQATYSTGSCPDEWVCDYDVYGNPFNCRWETVACCDKWICGGSGICTGDCPSWINPCYNDCGNGEPPPPPPCSCGGWTDDICGGGSCPADQMQQTRTCSPAGCLPETQCEPLGCGCDCDLTWTDVGCGLGGCLADQMYQTRTCTPAACDLENRCDSDNPACVATSCEISVSDVTVSGGPGGTGTGTVTIIDESPPGAFIEAVSFSSADVSIATVTTPDLSPVFRTTVTGVGVGGTTYTALATMNDGVTTCSPLLPGDIDVTNPAGWWQVKEGDVVTNGSIFSDIPPGCALPSCDPVFITADAGDFPGVPSCDGFSCSDFGSGTVSTDPPWGWNAEDSEYSSTQEYDYAFFEKRLPENIKSGWFEITIPTVGQVLLDAVAAGVLGSEIDGYYWYYYNGDLYGGVLTLDGNLDLRGTNRKVVLFVENADLQLNGRILVQKGQSSVLAIVDDNILIDPSVGGGVGPHIEGIYFTDGNFDTGTTGAAIPDDKQLYVRGSVVAPFGTVNLQRDLADNSATPGEIFEYGADQALLFPQDLADIRTIWREVAP